MIKVLYFGGQKSGKSQLAQDRALAISNEKSHTTLLLMIIALAICRCNKG